jgi:twitching motility protein PilT
MVAAFEVMQATTAVRNLIREGKTNQLRNQLLTGQQFGMQLLETSLNELVAAGKVSYDEAIAVSRYPKEIAKPVPVVSGEPSPNFEPIAAPV